MNGRVAALERLSRVTMIPLAPVLFVQAKRLRRETPRLPSAALPWHDSVPGPDPQRVLFIGDSTIAGVGVDTQRDGLPGNLSRLLTARTRRGVEWIATGESGATTRDVLDRFLVPGRFDLVMVSVGANDALGIRSRGAYARDIRSLLEFLRAQSPEAPILVSSMPGFSQFSLLPHPLKWVLSLHSRSLEAGARAVVAVFPDAAMSAPAPRYTEGFFASDAFHPGPSGYRDWAEFALDDAVAQGLIP